MRLFTAILFCTIITAAAAGGDVKGNLDWEGRRRTYEVHVPPGYGGATPAPLVFVLHGGGGNARNMRKLAPGLNDFADREGFLVVYPEGIERHWNDGRGLERYKAHRENVDDVGFLAALRERLESDYSVDPARVYAVGISNGAFMSYRLASESPGTVVAIGAVAGAMTVPLAEKYPPTEPVPVIMLSGTADPMVPYEGGTLKFFRHELGEVLSQKDTIALWLENNDCAPTPTRSEYPDRDPKDGTRVRREEYYSPAGADVVFVEIEGGGHTWPGGWQYLPAFMIGKACRDVDANEVVWEFFEAHPGGGADRTADMD